MDVGVAHCGEGGGVFVDLGLVFAVRFGGEGTGLEVDDPGLVGSEDDAVGAAHLAVDDNGGFALDLIGGVEVFAICFILKHRPDALADGLLVVGREVVQAAIGLDLGGDVVGRDDVGKEVVDSDAEAAAVGLERREEGFVLRSDADAFFPLRKTDAFDLHLPFNIAAVAGIGLRFGKIVANGVAGIGRGVA